MLPLMSCQRQQCLVLAKYSKRNKPVSVCRVIMTSGLNSRLGFPSWPPLRSFLLRTGKLSLELWPNMKASKVSFALTILKLWYAPTRC
jgi:hypothetical protein